MGAFMNIVELELNQLSEYENNPRINIDAIDKVAESIELFGFNVPIVADKDLTIICGHTRYNAAKKLGLKKVPVYIAENLTPDQVKAYRLVDNRVSDYAQWDWQKLFDEIETTSMDLTGFFDIEDIADKLPDIDTDEVKEDEVPELKEETITQPGDIWILGQHRLMCGDSTKKSDMQKLTGGVSVDMIVTDPPYNVDYKSQDGKKIKNDKMDEDVFKDFLHDAFMTMSEPLKQGGAIYVWYSNKHSHSFLDSFVKLGWTIRAELVWVKNAATMGHGDYQWRHEPCLYTWKDGGTHYFCDSRAETTVYDDKPNINKMSKEELKQLCKNLLDVRQETTVIYEDKPIKSVEHPTMKPVKLFARQIRNSSKRGQTVLDPFGGSGTTIIACEQMQRKGLSMEYDPKYCDVIVERWEKLTGQKAKLCRN